MLFRATPAQLVSSSLTRHLPANYGFWSSAQLASCLPLVRCLGIKKAPYRGARRCSIKHKYICMTLWCQVPSRILFEYLFLMEQVILFIIAN